MADCQQFQINLLIQLLSEGDEELEKNSYVKISQHIKKRGMFDAFLACIHERRKIPRVENFVESVVPAYTPDDFRNRFRMNRSTFDKLIQHLSEKLTVGNKGGYMRISVEKQLLIYIRYACSQQTLRDIADNFGVCEATVHFVVRRTSSIICSFMLPSLIKWPTGMHVQRITEAFFAAKGFPGILGAIDGSHIPIRTPSVDAEQYYNRKKFPSVVLQAVCDRNLHFHDVFCGWPGSVHDSRVLKNSPLFDKVSNNKEEMFPGNTHLIGDSAYGLSNWLMTPYKDFGNLSVEQKRYNFIHSSTRMPIEQAFGALKGRFRRLKYVDMLDIPQIVKFILSCCVLHELCLLNEDDFGEYLEEGLRDNEEVNDFHDFLPRQPSAEQKRQSIVIIIGG